MARPDDQQRALPGSGRDTRSDSPPVRIGRKPRPSRGGEPGAAAALTAGAGGIQDLRARAASCRACPLWQGGTQTVFGQGPESAPFLFVGEQPGDQEDRAGQPFVGPAGRLLDEALAAAGIDRRRAYVTNAVKHFKWEPRGKRRIHQKPNALEIAACKPWLIAEIERIRPHVIVCLGATAAQALLGPAFRVTKHRGELLPHTLAPLVLPTVHPSSILRARDDATRRAERDLFVRDLARLTTIAV